MTECYRCGKEIPNKLEGVYVREAWGIKIRFCSKDCYERWINE